jgi:hypothetical protein
MNFYLVAHKWFIEPPGVSIDPRYLRWLVKSAFLRHWLAGPELKDQLTPLMRECANLSHADMVALVASLRPEAENKSASSELPPATAAQ